MLFSRSGSEIRFLLREDPANVAAVSSTILSFPALCGLVTPRCGRYYILGVVISVLHSQSIIIFKNITLPNSNHAQHSELPTSLSPC